ncbi:MAG: acyltransferase, partial [Nitriliruptorales bacterium]|nr:acyltransferase [Nitriliruptorales bacterium]
MTTDRAQRIPTLPTVALVLASWFLLGLAGGLATLAVVVWVLRSEPSRDQVLAAAGIAFLATAVGWLAAGTPSQFEIASFTNLGGRGWLDGLTRVGLGLLAAAVLPVRAGSGEERSPPSPTPINGGRLPEVDRLRAIAIVTVVFIHGLPFKPPVTDAIDYWLSDITRFSVATLVFVSGWLLPRGPVGSAWVWHRLRRLVPAYLLASAVMVALSRLTPVIDERPLLQTLLMGDAVGPYYYVFVLVVLIAVTPFLQRLSSRMRWTLLGLSAAGALVIEVADLSLYAHNHLPLTWLPYYLAGYLLRPFRPVLGRLGDRAQGATVVAAGVVLALISAV